MPHPTLTIIHEEHEALAALLRSMGLMLAQSRRSGRSPDFEVLRAMLFYVDEFPERAHHPKETALLFPRLRQRCPGLAPVIDRLDREHAAGEAAIRELQHSLLAFEVLGEPRRAAFEQAVARYTRFYLEHMAVEEHQLLPAAREHFTAADWAELDAAFVPGRDPLTGHEVPAEYRGLFRRIVNRAPAPIGLA